MGKGSHVADFWVSFRRYLRYRGGNILGYHIGSFWCIVEGIFWVSFEQLLSLLKQILLRGKRLRDREASAGLGGGGKITGEG